MIFGRGCTEKGVRPVNGGTTKRHACVSGKYENILLENE